MAREKGEVSRGQTEDSDLDEAIEDLAWEIDEVLHPQQ